MVICLGTEQKNSNHYTSKQIPKDKNVAHEKKFKKELRNVVHMLWK